MTKGTITKIRIDPHEQILHQLFVDDIGIFMQSDEANFQEIWEVIAQYERISRAKLKLEKSTLIQMDSTNL